MPDDDYNYNISNTLVQQAMVLPPEQAETMLASLSSSSGEGGNATNLMPDMATAEGGNDCMYVDKLVNTMPPKIRRALPMTPPQKAAQQAQRAQVQRANALMGELSPTVMEGTTGLTQAQYLLEKADKKHRMGDILNLFFQEYKHDPSAGLDFFEWVDQQSYFTVVKVLQRSGFNPENVRAFAPAFLRGVKYMGTVERARYRVTIEGGKLMRGNQPFDTAVHSTIFCGTGWAIWVMSPGGYLYSGDHKKGELQHSGFLDGGNVKGAGEWQVTGGLLRAITGKSGHYKCNVDALHTAVSSMRDDGVEMRAASVYLTKSGQCETIAASVFIGMSASDRSGYNPVVNQAQLPFTKVSSPRPQPKFTGMSSHRVTVAPPAFNEHRQG